MKWLFDNPILVAQLRLAWRTGHVLPGLIIFGLVYGTILLSGIGAETEAEEGTLVKTLRKWDVLWVVLVQSMSLVLGGFSKVSREIQEDRSAGVLDFHRISPVSPGRILAGYLVGAPAREWLLGAMGATASLVFVWRGQLAFQSWLVVQALMISTAVLAHVFGAFVGQTLKRRGPVVLGAVGFVFLMMPNSFASGTSLLNFVVPSTALTQVFERELPPNIGRFFLMVARPRLFGVVCDPLMLTWLVQAVLTLLIGRAAWRRIRDPESAVLSRAEALALFLFLTVLQFGLITGARWLAGVGTVLAAVGLAFGAGGVILFGQTAQPWRLRKQFRRQRKEGCARPWLETAVGWSVFFAAVTTALLMVALLQMNPRLRPTSIQFAPAMALMAASFGATFLQLALVVESLRLWLGRRSPGFQGTALFVLWVMPFIVGLFFAERIECIALSPLASSPLLLHGLMTPWWLEPEEIRGIVTGLVLHWLVVIAFGALWWWQRQKVRATLAAES
ncbi:MAG: hypothetical protein HZA91_12270 [Verrucomicrobia bacterium]|nr:hypothetical protein [Verrucomicrobiota bacterium]